MDVKVNLYSGNAGSSSTGRQDDPPSYKEVTGVADAEPEVRIPLLVQKDQPSAITVVQPSAPSLGAVVEDVEEEEEGKMVLVRFFIVVAIAVGIGLCVWEVSYQNSLGSHASRMARKQIGLRAGFGGFLLVFAVLAYFVDAFTNRVYKLISAGTDEYTNESPADRLQKINRGRPKVTWYIKCFRHERNTTVITEADGSLHTQQNDDIITSWTGTEEFHFTSWSYRAAEDPKEMPGWITRINFEKAFIFANEESQMAYQAEKQAFIDANRHRDAEFNITEIFEIDGFQKEFSAASSSAFCVYLMAAFTCLLYPLMCCVNSMEKRLTITRVAVLAL
ncbi:uncharacterized protein LOC129601126 [Paramacrobiotus metropolitanus]|uniref:uncharacterized protein LOC129601126 n=1 Tax=Paramacrobiotus metropolitanus TaxID=2943436 RepID=UPI0024461D21|nr:uncharacterized protein LOC129601126 [Paramacrobiotus metropolitanus]